VQRFISYRGNGEKKLGDDAENNTAIAIVGSNRIVQSCLVGSLIVSVQLITEGELLCCSSQQL